MSCSTSLQNVFIEALGVVGQNLLFLLKEVEAGIALTLGEIWLVLLEKKCLSLICLKHLNKSTFRPNALTPLVVGTNDKPLESRDTWSLDSSFEEMFITVSVWSCVSRVAVVVVADHRLVRLPLLHFFFLLCSSSCGSLKKEPAGQDHSSHCRM